MTDDENDLGYHADILMRTNADTGISVPDALSLTAWEQSQGAKRWREAHGITDQAPAPRPDMIDTGPFASRCTITATIWPPGSPFRVRLMAVRAGDLPADVRERLRAEGCGPWVDALDSMIPLGEEMALGRPRNPIAVAEIVTLIKATPTPAERRE